MNRATGKAVSHAALMNATYRHQRRIYDVTRKVFLFGRDRLIANLDPPAGGHVLEIACGTGRNLAVISKRHPGCHLYGLDISSEMLRSARARLGDRATLTEADACDFDAAAMFGVAKFDRVVFSYALSMIPDWTGALRAAASHLTEGGQVHVVDFGDQNGLPDWFGAGLRALLARYHVEPRTQLSAVMHDVAAEIGGLADCGSLYRDYASYAVLSKG